MSTRENVRLIARTPCGFSPQFPKDIVFNKNCKKDTNTLYYTYDYTRHVFILVKLISISVSARPEFLGVIDDPLFENLGVIGKFRGSELF